MSAGNDDQTITTLPSPMDAPEVTDLLESVPPLRWGMISCSRVCHDFIQALKHVPSQKVVCCSVSKDADLPRAQEFAKKHNITKTHGSYAQVWEDTDVDIVYVGNIHYNRRTLVEQIIKAGKHVLVEKPFACTYEDAKYLIDLARAKQDPPVFVLEGMWTRFFPIIEQARKIVFHDKCIGDICNVVSDFNFVASDTDPYPSSFFYNRKLGGGANLLVGPYPAALCTLFFGGEGGRMRQPKTIKSVGQVDAKTGVELQIMTLLEYDNTSTLSPAEDPENKEEHPSVKLPGSGVACLTYGMVGESDECTKVVGTKGRLTIETPCHCPTNMRVEIKAQGRGQKGRVLRYDYPLPPDTKEIIDAGGYYYPNSAGFVYEAVAAARCIAAGVRECPQYTWDEILLTAKILDETRQQLGTKTVYED